VGDQVLAHQVPQVALHLHELDEEIVLRVEVTSSLKLDRPKLEIPGESSPLDGRRIRRKKSKFTEEQIAFALRQADTGTKVPEICRQMGISQANFYAWRKKCGGLGIAELRRLKQLKHENRRLKQLVADLSLDKEMLQEVIRKKL